MGISHWDFTRVGANFSCESHRTYPTTMCRGFHAPLGEGGWANTMHMIEVAHEFVTEGCPRGGLAHRSYRIEDKRRISKCWKRYSTRGKHQAKSWPPPAERESKVVEILCSTGVFKIGYYKRALFPFEVNRAIKCSHWYSTKTAWRGLLICMSFFFNYNEYTKYWFSLVRYLISENNNTNN